jgi:hypothetical protein
LSPRESFMRMSSRSPTGTRVCGVESTSICTFFGQALPSNGVNRRDSAMLR